MDGDTKGEKEKRFEEANILSFPCSRYRYLLGVSPGPRRVIYILPRGPFESVRSFFSPLRREGAAPLFSFLFFFLFIRKHRSRKRHVNYDHGSGSPRPTVLPVIIPLPSCALATVSCKPAHLWSRRLLRIVLDYQNGGNFNFIWLVKSRIIVEKFRDYVLILFSSFPLLMEYSYSLIVSEKRIEDIVEGRCRCESLFQNWI